jgi:hypothetical protein
MKNTRLFLALILGLALNAGPASAQEPAAGGQSCDEHSLNQTFAPVDGASRALKALAPGDLSPSADFPFLTVQIGKIKNYNSWQKEKLERARRLMETAINSEAFKERVLAHTYKGQLAFADNQGRSNAEIYESIRKAVELGFDNQEFVSNFNHRLYKHWWPWSKVVGYTDIGQPWVNTNKKHFKKYTDAVIAGHLTHEWLHLLGYLHDSTFAGSVPYDVGDIVSDIAAQIVQ